MAKDICILYSEVDVGGDMVDCIYLVKDECRAQPFVDVTKVYYKPTEQEKKDYCRSGSPQRNCPRFVGYQEHLKAIGLVK
jgi:hypothetical protein